MNNTLYLFVGTTNALHFYLNSSSAADKDTALTSSSALQSVSESLLTSAAANPASDFDTLFDEYVVTVIESIEQLRVTQAYQGLAASLMASVDDFYSKADLLMGGGGCDLDHEHYGYCGIGSAPGFTG